VPSGREPVLRGDAAEGAAFPLLACHFTEVEHIGKSGGPGDFRCRGLRPRPNYTASRTSAPSDDERVLAKATFHFQIKSAASGQGSPRIARPAESTFSWWMDQAEREPVFILAIRQLSGQRSASWMLCVHDLILNMALAGA